MVALSIQDNSPLDMSDIAIDIADFHATVPIDHSLIELAVRIVLTDAGVQSATVSVAIVDDSKITRLNREFLNHDYATDVLSFTLSDPHTPLEGEVIVSAETAARTAARYGWEAPQELLTYIIHGTLHLVGYEDASPTQRAKMQLREADVLTRLGIAIPVPASSCDAQDDEESS